MSMTEQQKLMDVLEELGVDFRVGETDEETSYCDIIIPLPATATGDISFVFNDGRFCYTE